MTNRQPTDNPEYWKSRLARAKQADALHQAIFLCPKDTWLQIEAKHRTILAHTIKPSESVLDAGCGYGRLLTLMPPSWWGPYCGVDVSPDFIALARELHPDRHFECASLLAYNPPNRLWHKFDWGILISIRPMIVRNQGAEIWGTIETRLRDMCHNLLYLEYDPTDEGSTV